MLPPKLYPLSNQQTIEPYALKCEFHQPGLTVVALDCAEARM